MRMKKCGKCGKTFDDSWKVCLHCATPLDSSSEDLLIPEIVSGDIRTHETNVGGNIGQGVGCTITALAYLIMGGLGMAIYIWTIIIAYNFSGIFGAALSLMFPVIAQIVWGIKMWIYTGTFMNYYCMAIIGYVIACIIVLVGFSIFGKDLT